MARITVEDCIDKFPSRFELVLVASQRAKKLHSGDSPTIDKDNDKNTVIALREIAVSSISVDQMKENLIQEYQTITISDEEEENLVLEANDLAESNDLVDGQEKEKISSSEIESEIKELVTAEDSEIENQYEISDIENEDISEKNETESNTDNNEAVSEKNETESNTETLE